MSFDPQTERFHLMVRAKDQGRTTGELAAIEKAQLCEELAARYEIESPSKAAGFFKKAKEWRKISRGAARSSK